MAITPVGPHFITGAAGFFGRRFLERMASGVLFRALVHRRPLPVLPNVEPVRGSLQDGAGLVRLLEGVDAVVHFAAVTHASRRETYLRVNATGTANLVRAARQAGVRRFIHISSRAIGPECGDYAKSKHQAESEVRASGIPHVILRFAEIYGAGSSEGLNALVALVRRSPLVPYPSGPARLAPLLLDDAVEAVATVLSRPLAASGTYVLAGPRSYTLPEVVAVMTHHFGVRRLLLPIPVRLLSVVAAVSSALGRPLLRYDQISRLMCVKDSDIDRARRDLGFAPVPFEEGVRHVYPRGATP